MKLIGGKYRLIRPLGEGAMGSVHEAENTWTGRRVAIKVLRKDVARNKLVVDRFLFEGRSTAMISHPNVVEVLDMGQDADDGALYIVQEFLSGIGLHELMIKRGRFPLRDALDIVVPVMGGLAAAHQRNVIHRDVKPENIILARSGQGRTVPKLIDFSISKLIGFNARITLPGTLIGTPHYMAPEQVAGVDEIDTRADIWAVGVLLYEMLSGANPFAHDDVRQIFAKICQGEIVPVAAIVPEVPQTVSEIIAKAMQRDLALRIATMGDFLEAMLRCVEIADVTEDIADKHRDAIPYQRQHPRYNVNWHCALRCPDWSTAQRIALSNVSRGGLFVATTEKLSLGLDVDIDLELPDRTMLHLRGRVIRVSDSDRDSIAGVAIQFHEQHSTELHVLEQFAIRQTSPTFEELPPEAEARPAAKQSTPPAKATDPARPQQRAPAQPSLADAVGIDFGTTYSSLSIALGDRVYPVADRKQRALQPSVVAYPERGHPVVGWSGRTYLLSDPGRTITSVKRVLGRSYDDSGVDSYLHGQACPSAKGPNNSVVFEIDGHHIAAVQVAAQIIEHLRQIGEERTSKRIVKAVLSVPIAYSAAQREAIRRAAQLAGMEILELIEEPLAGLLAYGFGQGLSERVAVYDFGGGTFDFCVIELKGNQYQILGSGGDPWLGGDDLDLALAEFMANEFWRDTDIDLRLRTVEWQRLLFACERAKRVLSIEEETEIVVSRVVEAPQPIDFRRKLRRSEMEEICFSVFHRSLEVCEDVLQKVSLAPKDINRLVVTGGTSRIPFVQRELGQFFNKPITAAVDPELSVCIGSGIRAASLAGHGVREAAHRKTA